jgi:ferredoxin
MRSRAAFPPWRWLLLVLLLGVAAPSMSAGIDVQYPQVRGFFPEADRFGALEGEPLAAPVYRGTELLGYAFLTADVVRIPAYSGQPINTLVAFDTAGRIVGIQIVDHQEPILLVGISDERLARFVAQYRGKGVYDKLAVGGAREDQVTIDAISGATITVMVENATVMQAVRQVALARGLTPERIADAASNAKPLPPATELPAISATVATKPVRKGESGKTPKLPTAAAPPVATGPSGTVDEPIWKAAWRGRTIEISLLMTGLGLLTLLMVFQDWLAQNPRLLRWLRTGFLVYTLVFIGWYSLAQLSVVNVLVFTQAISHDFQWESFLIDPMLFILWSFVAISLLLWGRGVYCGWLCPFGALQELSWRLGQRLGVRSYELPQMVHERLWALKYIILLGLFGMSLQSLAAAERLVEVEPFKTAITMRFMREWGFVLYAGGLITIGLFNRKFFCKYLCSLGAALTIGGKFRIFDWLRRHRECGRPCQICAVECEVQAIRKNGEINPNECHYCLGCQVTYWETHKCPPMVERRKRREKAEQMRVGAEKHPPNLI